MSERHNVCSDAGNDQSQHGWELGAYPFWPITDHLEIPTESLDLLTEEFDEVHCLLRPRQRFPMLAPHWSSKFSSFVSERLVNSSNL